MPLGNNDEGREVLAKYFCDLHNNVNNRLQKPQFDCASVFEYWGGECGCDGSSDDGQNKTSTNVTKTTDDQPK